MADEYPTSFEMSTSTEANQGVPTVVAAKDFKADSDAEALNKAFKGIGNDAKAIIQILCNRSNAQRQKIAESYQQMFGKKLVDKLVSELKGNMEEVMVALMDTPPQLDARMLRKAMKGMGTQETVLIDILCSRNNEQIKEIKKTYKEMHNRDLDKDVQSETSGDFRKVLTSLLMAARDEDGQVDMEKAKNDADALHRAGEGKWGTDESTFNRILAKQSFRQLQEVFNQYEKKFHRGILEVIKSEFSGDLKRAHYTLAACCLNRQRYYADVLVKTMKGAGTDDTRLIFVIVSRCEVDLADIKKQFHKAQGKTLEQWIQEDTSGKYRDALLALVNGNVQ